MRSLRLPDTIIAGAPRSGTTWLYRVLERHPEVYMARPVVPEPKFFLRDDLYSRGLEYYARTWFSAAKDARVAGEKSTNYLEGPAVAERIRRDLPAVKLVFLLREPAERAFSNYLWSRMNGLEPEPFARALALEERRERDLPPERRYSRPHAYFSRGLYADLLAPFFARFPREQLLCLRFEDVAADPGALAARVHAFLGLAPRPEDARGLGPQNASDSAGERLPAQVRRALRERYREPNARLRALLGPSFPGWEDA